MKVFDGLYAFLWNSMSANNCNTYLIDGPKKVLIDPGHLHLFDHVADGLKQLGLALSDIDLVLVTHAHPDHFEAVKLFKDQPARLGISSEDWLLLQEIGRYMGPAFDRGAYEPDFFLDGDNLEAEGVNMQMFRTPGHSLGSVSLFWPGEKALFTGDVLFRDGLGRTDLPGGNGESLKKSIMGLSSLDAEWLLPGHGDIVSGAAQVKANFKRVEEVWFAYI